MFDSRIFYLQMADSRNRPQVVNTEKRRDTHARDPRNTRRAAAR